MRWPWSRRAIEDPDANVGAAASVPDDVTISSAALAELQMTGRTFDHPFKATEPMPGVLPVGKRALAFDDAPPFAMGAAWSWALTSAFHEGIAFLGYPYLAQLSQRSEYRRMSEIWAEHATRKWIKLTGGNEEDSRLSELMDELDRFAVRDRFREAAEQDGFFGRSHIFPDFGDANDDAALMRPLSLQGELLKGKLENFKVVEPFWMYPGRYNTQNPLDKDFYKPEIWYVMGKIIHHSRVLTLIGREVPDILKANYMFGGLSLSQMAKPYVDNWLRARQSTSDMLHSYSVMVLATEMGSRLMASDMRSLIARAQMFNQFRDNRGLQLINKEKEELTNIAAPLSSVPELTQQALEHVCSAIGMPLIIYLGITPSGLNASSEGEIRTFYDNVHSYQERVFRSPLQRVIEIVQLHKWGEVDPTIGFEFEPLWQMDDEAKARIRKSDADAAASYINTGVISADEDRERLANEEDGMYDRVDLEGAAPGPPELPTDQTDMAALLGTSEKPDDQSQPPDRQDV